MKNFLMKVLALSFCFGFLGFSIPVFARDSGEGEFNPNPIEVFY